MVSLLDLGDLSETVMVSGKPVTVSGISAEGVLYLLQKFPELRALMTGHASDVKPEALMTMAPKAIASIIAAGLGYPGNEEVETKAGRIGFGSQVELIAAVMRMTFPEGIGPFVERLQALSQSSEEVAAAVLPNLKSAVVSGKAQDTKSPEASS